MISRERRDELFAGNVAVIEQLADGSRSAIKGLIMDLEKNGIFIELRSASEHTAYYTLIDGSNARLVAVGRALGITITDNTITAAH